MLYVSLVWSLHQPQVPWLTAWKAKPQTITLSHEVGTCRLWTVGRQTFCVHLLNNYHTWTRSKFKKGKKGACKWAVVMWWYMINAKGFSELKAKPSGTQLNLTSPLVGQSLGNPQLKVVGATAWPKSPGGFFRSWRQGMPWRTCEKKTAFNWSTWKRQ